MMLSGNGGCFRAEIEAAVLKHFNMEPRFTSPNHPQSNGLCERANGVISTVLGKLMATGEYKADFAQKLGEASSKDCIEDWPEKLDEVAFLCNTKPQSIPKKTPYEVVCGIKCNPWVSESLKKVGETTANDESTTVAFLCNIRNDSTTANDSAKYERRQHYSG